MSNLSLDDQLTFLLEMSDYIKYHKIEFFKPDNWQREALALGKTERVRGCLLGNRMGKTYFGTYELAVHLTGLYPDDWDGYRFDKPINAMALGSSWGQISLPGSLHDLLFGPRDSIGTGWIPKDRMLNKISAGVFGCFKKVEVKHACGGISTITIGSYEQSDVAIMGANLDFFLIDEQPSDKNILPQLVKRTWSSNGIGLATFTPEKGMSETVAAFWNEDGIYHKGLINYSLYDSGLYTPERIQEMVKSIPPWQYEFSVMGRPSAGTGAVFAGIMKSDICQPLPKIEEHWLRICAIDFGYKDDNIVTFLAKDPSRNVYYLYDEIKTVQKDAAEIAPLIIPRQQNFIPMIAPPDGMAERGVGTTLLQIYKERGVLCLEQHAANYMLDPEGKNRSISSGISWIRSLMKSGQFFVDPKCQAFLHEFDLYSYDESGKFIDKYNHAIDSLRYAITAIDRFGVSLEKSRDAKGYSYIPEIGWND